MIVIQILLGLAALWALVSVVVLGAQNLSWPTDAGGMRFGIATVQFILALGFLGLLLK